MTVATETGTLKQPSGPITRITPQPEVACGERQMAGSAGVQISWRTARTLWEHLPRGVSRDDYELVALKAKASRPWTAARLGRIVESHGPTGVRRPCGYGAPRSGGAIARIASSLRHTGEPFSTEGRVNASRSPGARNGRGRWPPMPPLPMHRAGRDGDGP